MSRAALRRPFEWMFGALHRRELESLSGFPGPKPVWPFGNALELIGPTHRLLEGWRDRYGDVVAFWLWGHPSLLVSDPATLRSILEDEADEWHKNVPRGATEPIMGQSVFRSPGGDDWKKKRSAHPFEAGWVERWYESAIPTVCDVTRRRFAAAEGPADLFDVLTRVSFESFGRTVLGLELDDDAFAEHETLLKEIAARGALPVPFSWNPVFFWRRRRWLGRIESRLDDTSLASADDLLSRMVARGGPALGTIQRRDELSNIFTAGMKNVAICAAGVLYELLRAPEILAAVEAETRPLFRDGLPTPSALRELPAFHRAVQESMRLHPVVPGFVREVKPGRAVKLNGERLPERTQVFVTIWNVHRHPDHWDDPLRYDPARFAGEAAPEHYMPFGVGPRSCVGEEQTLLFSKAIAATALEGFRITLDDDATFETTMSAGTAPPKRGVRATIRAR